jgi:hypothetical protein
MGLGARGGDVRVRFEPWPGRPGRSLCTIEQPVGEAFDALVARIAPAVEERLRPQVHAVRLADPSRLLPEDWRRARERFLRAVHSFDRNGVGLRLDVEDCYRSLRPACVAQAVEPLAPGMGEWVERALRRLVEAGVTGLPVGPVASDVLANAALLEVDRVLDREPVAWVRWVDDVLIVAGSEPALARAEERSAAALARHGLRWNGGKRRGFRPGFAPPPVAPSRTAPRTTT